MGKTIWKQRLYVKYPCGKGLALSLTQTQQPDSLDAKNGQLRC